LISATRVIRDATSSRIGRHDESDIAAVGRVVVVVGQPVATSAVIEDDPSPLVETKTSKLMRPTVAAYMKREAVQMVVAAILGFILGMAVTHFLK
jgi:hypothetical protein